MPKISGFPASIRRERRLDVRLESTHFLGSCKRLELCLFTQGVLFLYSLLHFHSGNCFSEFFSRCTEYFRYFTFVNG
eukprot:g66243.t1